MADGIDLLPILGRILRFGAGAGPSEYSPERFIPNTLGRLRADLQQRAQEFDAAQGHGPMSGADISSRRPDPLTEALTGKPVHANEYDGQKRSVAPVAQESAPPQTPARQPRNAIEAAAMKTGLMDQLAKRMREAAGAEAGVGEANAADALAVVKALRGGDMEQKFAAQLAAQEKFKERPKLERLADAILQGGGWLDVRSKNPIGAAAQNYSKVSDADEAKFEKKQEKEMKNFLTRMGFAKEDVAALNAKDAAMLAARQGGRTAPLVKSKTEAAIAEAMLGQSNKERQFSLEGQKIGAMQRPTPAQTHKEWVDYFLSSNPGMKPEDANKQAKEMMLRKPEAAFVYKEDAAAPIREQGMAQIEKYIPEKEREAVRMKFLRALSVMSPAQAAEGLQGTITQYQTR